MSGAVGPIHLYQPSTEHLAHDPQVLITDSQDVHIHAHKYESSLILDKEARSTGSVLWISNSSNVSTLGGAGYYRTYNASVPVIDVRNGSSDISLLGMTRSWAFNEPKVGMEWLNDRDSGEVLDGHRAMRLYSSDRSGTRRLSHLKLDDDTAEHTAATIDRPQYICLNGIGVGQTPTAAQLQATLVNLSGVTRSADGRRRLCMSEQWSVLGKGANTTKMLQQLDDFLAMSLAHDLPISVSIDATQWWENAEHLWNWWNTSRPTTFNEDNRHNVEWTGWSPENATRISWRNWGSQFRITASPGFFAPPPNFASPAFRAAAAEAMLPLLRRIASWYRALPPEKKNLLAYVRSTQELWQGTNYYYYQDGNDRIGKNASNDPTGGPSKGCAQLGYAASCATDGQCSGNLSLSQLDAPIHSYCDFANQLLLGVGIPRSRVMCHTGFKTNPNPQTSPAPLMNTPAVSVTSSGAPAWSMYVGSTPVAVNGGWELEAALDAVDSTPWGAPEWMPFNLLGGKGSEQQWLSAFDDILSFRNNRLVVMQSKIVMLS